MKLYFEFDCLDCFSPIFAPPTEKSFPRLCSKSPKLLSTLTLLLCFLISALCYDSSRKWLSVLGADMRCRAVNR